MTVLCFSGQSFHIENPREDPSLRYVVHTRNRRSETTSRASTSNDSEGSMEGTYNFAVEDDEIDEGMFAGDSNSARVQEPPLRYMDPAALNHALQASSELNEGGEGIRLEKYQPRLSPGSFKNETAVYTSADVSGGAVRSSEPANAKNADLEGAYETIIAFDTRGEGFNNLPKGSAGMAISASSSEDEDDPPDWIPLPPPVQNYHSPVYNDREDRRSGPDYLVKGADKNASNGRSATVPTSKQGSSENNDVNNRLSVNGNEPQLYTQVDHSKKSRTANKESPDSGKNELLNESLYDADTSEDDFGWPPPPPPPQVSNTYDDSEWERPLPPEIMALPGKRNRVALWANDD